jgi:hypothetical protein
MHTRNSNRSPPSAVRKSDPTRRPRPGPETPDRGPRTAGRGPGYP